MGWRPSSRIHPDQPALDDRDAQAGIGEAAGAVLAGGPGSITITS